MENFRWVIPPVFFILCYLFEANVWALSTLRCFLLRSYPLRWWYTKPICNPTSLNLLKHNYPIMPLEVEEGLDFFYAECVPGGRSDWWRVAIQLHPVAPSIVPCKKTFNPGKIFTSVIIAGHIRETARDSGKPRRSWRTQKYLLSDPIFSHWIWEPYTMSFSEANCILKMGNIWRSFW